MIDLRETRMSSLKDKHKTKKEIKPKKPKKAKKAKAVKKEGLIAKGRKKLFKKKN